MTEKIEYKEVEFDQHRPYIEQLNEQGLQGWEFCTQAQRLENTLDFKTGQQKVILITIYKRKIIVTNGQA